MFWQTWQIFNIFNTAAEHKPATSATTNDDRI